MSGGKYFTVSDRKARKMRPAGDRFTARPEFAAGAGVERVEDCVALVTQLALFEEL